MIWKCYSSPLSRGLPASRRTKLCSRGATLGEIERLGHRRNADLRARLASLNEHGAHNIPRGQAGGEPVHDLQIAGVPTMHKLKVTLRPY
jgi:hypothetical protein